MNERLCQALNVLVIANVKRMVDNSNTNGLLGRG